MGSFYEKVNQTFIQISLTCILLLLALIAISGLLLKDSVSVVIAGLFLPASILIASGYMIYGNKLYSGTAGLLAYTAMVSTGTIIILMTIPFIGFQIDPLGKSYGFFIASVLIRLYAVLAMILPILAFRDFIIEVRK